MVHDDDLGPLPHSDRPDDLQELSLRALTDALPVSHFYIRDARANDRGVDARLEVKVDGKYTNLEAKLQLKATDSERLNQDGSFSLSVATSNLNYLLNGQSPIYVVYLVGRKELRYAWARDEHRRVEHENPTWRSQETVTLRFRQTLTAQAVEEIHTRIRREGRLDRHIHDVLSRTADAGPITTLLDPASSSATDPREISESLSRSGLALVARGSAADVVRLAALLNPDMLQSARIQLALAYAHHELGEHHTALGHLQRAIRGHRDLSQEGREFLDYLKDACEYQTGLASEQEFQRRQEGKEQQGTGLVPLVRRLDRLRLAFDAESDEELSERYVDQILATAQEVHQRDDAPSALKLQAQLVTLFYQLATENRLLGDGVAGLRMRDATTRRATATDIVRLIAEHAARLRAIHDAVTAAATEALCLEHPPIFADALLLRAMVLAAPVSCLRVLAASSGVRIPTPPDVLATARDDAEKAMEVYQAAGYTERYLQAAMLLADIAELEGDLDKARELAERVLPDAEAMYYDALAKRARDHIVGSSWQGSIESVLLAAHADNYDALLAGADDTALDATVRMHVRLAGTPQDGVSAIREQWLARRIAARERLDWCRYIDLENGIGRCLRHRHQAPAALRDPARAIAAFKQGFCASCPGRDPKCQQGPGEGT